MAEPGSRGAYVRLETRVTGSPNRGAYNELLEDWTLIRTAWVVIDQPTRAMDAIMGDVRRFESVQRVRGDHYDLDGLAAGDRIVHDPLGVFTDETRNVYFRVEGVHPDFASKGETIVQVRRTDKAGSEV